MASQRKEVKSMKACISLYETDVDQVARIMSFMLEHKQPITRSNAVQLGLRAIRLNEKLLELLDAIKAEDQRRRPTEGK